MVQNLQTIYGILLTKYVNVIKLFEDKKKFLNITQLIIYIKFVKKNLSLMIFIYYIFGERVF